MLQIKRINCLLLTAYCLLVTGAALAGEFHVIMKEGDWVFEPEVSTIQKGDTVVWTNKDDSHHTVTFEDPSTKGSENIKPGRQFSQTFDKSGEYKYYCKYHRDYKMQGKIVVK